MTLYYSNHSNETSGGWWAEIEEDGLIVMAGMERCQTCGFHIFDVFDTVPLITFQPLR